jgi:hypothetical protein
MDKTAFLSALATALARRGVPYLCPDLETFVDGAWPRFEERPDGEWWAEEYAQLVLRDILCVGLGRCLSVVYDALGMASGCRGKPGIAPGPRRLPTYPPLNYRAKVLWPAFLDDPSQLVQESRKARARAAAVAQWAQDTRGTAAKARGKAREIYAMSCASGLRLPPGSLSRIVR